MSWAPAQSSAQLREPGLWRADPYLERYHVAGTSLIVIALNSGDTLTVTDPEGAQVAEVVAFDSEGRPDPRRTWLRSARTRRGLSDCARGPRRSACSARS